VTRPVPGHWAGTWRRSWTGYWVRRGRGGCRAAGNRLGRRSGGSAAGFLDLPLEVVQEDGTVRRMPRAEPPDPDATPATVVPSGRATWRLSGSARQTGAARVPRPGGCRRRVCGGWWSGWWRPGGVAVRGGCRWPAAWGSCAGSCGGVRGGYGWRGRWMTRVAGRGGVAGVQQGVVVAGGVGAGGSWEGLERAVERAGAGASAWCW